MPGTLEGVGKIFPLHHARQWVSNQPGLIIASFAHSLLAERNRHNRFRLPPQGVETEGNIPGERLPKPNIAAIFQFEKRRTQWLLKNSTRPERIKRWSCIVTVFANPWKILRLSANLAQGFWRRGQLPPAVCAPALPKFSAASAAGREDQVQSTPKGVEEVVRRARAYGQNYQPPNTLDSIIRNTAGVISTIKMDGKINTIIGISILTGA